jgi:flagellar biosynthetic protein FliR
MDLLPWLDLAQSRLNTILLLFARFTALFLAAPVVSARQAPRPVRLGLAAFLTLVLAPLTLPVAIEDGILFACLIGREIFLGLLLGWTASLVFMSVQMAGEWLDLHAGFQAAHLFNPALEVQTSLLGTFKHLVAVVLFLGVGGHVVVLRAAASSLELSPPGVLRLSMGIAGDWTTLVTRTVLVAVQLAAPVAATLFLVEVGMGLINRALPQVNVLMMSLPAKAALALCVLALSLPLLIQSLTALFESLGPMLSGVLRTVSG